MLTDADKQIIAADQALPGLIALLDSEALLRELRRLPRLQNITAIEIQYLRYKPGNSCTCTVCVKTADGPVQYYFAKALTEERFKQSWHHPKRQKMVREDGPYAPLALFDLYIMLLHPAFDRGIRYLDWLINEESRRRILALCGLSPERQSDMPEIDILRYKPERRLVARVRHAGRPLAIIRCTNATNFGSTLTGAAFGTAQGNMKLLGIDGSIRTLVTAWQKGDSLCPEKDRFPSLEIIARLAKRLARIHHSSYRHPVHYDVNDEIRALQSVADTFRYILPDHTQRFSELIRRTEQGLVSQPQILTLIHGDFSLDQVVQTQNKAGVTKLRILDWDRAATGHPLMDPASLQARLELQVIEGVVSRTQTDDLLRIFLQRYRKKSGYALDGLRYFVAAALLRLSTEPFRKRAPRWPQDTLRLLDRVEEILLDTGNRPSVKTEKPIDISRDPVLSTLTDRDRMQALLAQALPSASRETLKTATLKRYKPQRRALIEYVFRTTQGDRHILGKYRSKGPDKRAYAIQQALWNASFNQASNVSVAEPLGILNDQHTWLQRKVEGQTVGEMLSPDNDRLAFLGSAVAGALAALHQSAVAKTMVLPLWTPEREMQILRERLAQAQLLRPQFAERIAAVLCACETLATRLTEAEAPVVSVHRDFYQDQILERHDQPGRMVLLDLDLLCRGPAALDAGNYLAHIQELALRQYADVRALAAHQEAFLNTFAAQSSAVDMRDIEDYTTLSLARHIYLSTQFPERTHTTGALLAICEDRLKRRKNI